MFLFFFFGASLTFNQSLLDASTVFHELGFCFFFNLCPQFARRLFQSLDECADSCQTCPLVHEGQECQSKREKQAETVAL